MQCRIEREGKQHVQALDLSFYNQHEDQSMSGTNDNTPMNEADLLRIEQDYSPVNDLGKLVLKIAKNCARQELHTVYDALEMLMLTVLEQIPDDTLRNQHA